MKQIPLAEFVACYPSRSQAAEAISVSRQTLYDWEKNHKGMIPDPWCWKAAAMMQSMSPKRRRKGKVG